MSKKRVFLIATGLTLLFIAFGVYVFRNGVYSFWDSDVKRIDTQEAQQMLQKKSYVLIDARAQDEFAVSHLKGSMLYEESLVHKLNKNEPILIYCTIGVRSNRIAKQLSDMGFEVYDMQEGILGWANNELPVIDSAGNTTKNIHTYNKSFAPLLKKGTAVY